LLQDIAIVPLVLMVSFLGTGNTDVSIPWHIATIGAAALGLGVVLYLLLYHVVPRLLASQGLFANRELTVLLAIAVGLGAAWSAHALGLSPALGAFLAGILLGESPFAAQIRSDIGSLRTIMVTLFFASVGMLAKPVWFVQHLHWILPAAGIIFMMKAIIVYIVGRLFGLDRRHSLATGITMAQVGEFSFVLVTVAFTGGILDRFAFDLMVSTTIVLMFAAPYMVTYAYGFADRALALMTRKSRQPTDSDTDDQKKETCAVIVVGLGPAGREVVRHLVDRQINVEVIEINPRSQAMADELGVKVHLGDATSEEILVHAGIKSAQMVVVTLPNPADSIKVVDLLSKVRPDMPVAVRCRYNRHVEDVQQAGARIVIDEESVVGHTLAHEVSEFLFEADGTALACRLSGKPLPVSGETEPLSVEP
jgi:CPA2 family monovalent cation:H+ antiporter-2